MTALDAKQGDDTLEKARAPLPNTGQAPITSPGRNADAGLVKLTQILRRRKEVIVGACALVTVLGTLTAFQLTPYYTAEALIMVNVRKTSVVDLHSVMSGLPPEASAVRSEVDVLDSRALLGKVVDKLNLTANPVFNPSLESKGILAVLTSPSEWLPATWREALIGPDVAMPPDVAKERTRSATITTLSKMLKVSNDGRSYSLRLSVSFPDAKGAALLANTISDLYLLDQLEAKYEATRRANDWLSERLGGLRDQVQAAERAVQAYREKSGLNQTRGATVTTQQLAEINTQLVLARSERSQAEARLRNAQSLVRGGNSGGVEAVSNVLASPLIQRLREQESTVRRKDAEMSGRYGPEHPQRINVRAELADIRYKIDEETHKVVLSLANEVDIAKAKEQSLESALADLQGKANVGMRAEVGLAQLERESESARSLYQNMLTRFKEVGQQESLQENDARIISRAEPPTQTSFPRKGLFALLSLLSGGLLGVIFAFVLERFDRGFRGASDVEEKFGIPVFALVPMLVKASVRPEDYLLDKPLSAFSESLRTLRTGLQFTNVDNPVQTIAITSSVPREGKTTVSISLGRQIAQSGQKVLLIDGDLRRPQVGKLFGAGKANAGLPEVLAGKATLEEAIIVDEKSGLHLLPCHAVAPLAHSMIGSRRMGQVLATLRKSYDMILIDTPPIMAVSDAALLCALADCTVFVVHWGSSPREVVSTAINQLRSFNINLAGIILSQVDLRRHATYGYGDYGYYYGRYREYYHN